MLDDDASQFIGKVLFGLLGFCLQRVDVSLSNDPDFYFLLRASDDAGHAEVGDGKTELEVVDGSPLLIRLLHITQLHH